jgi:hypothetical protein
MDVISREIKGGLPWELLYEDDLLLMAESDQELLDKLRRWTRAMDANGMEVNIEKTKVMWNRGDVQTESTARHPSALCNKGVGSYSMCEKCNKWTHKRCSGIQGSLNTVKGFECSRCRVGDKHLEERSALELEEGVRVERVSGFYYLGDITEEEGGSDGAIAGRIAKGYPHCWGQEASTKVSKENCMLLVLEVACCMAVKRGP